MNKIAKSAIMIISFMVLSKVLGLVREILLARKFGTNYVMDAYAICCSLPTVLFTIFASGFSHAYLPIYSRITDEESKSHFFSNVINLLTLLSILIAIICFKYSNKIVHILAPGFHGKIVDLTDLFIRIVVLYLPFYTVFSILAAHLNASENFVFSNFCDFIIANMILIISILFANMENPVILVYGFVLSMVIPAIMLFVYAVKKKKATYIWYFSPTEKTFMQLCSMAIPIGLSLFINQINAVIDRVFSSSLGEGITSALGYANRIQLIPYSLVIAVFLSVCRPRINLYFAERQWEKGMFYVRKAMMISIYISFPVVVFLSLYSMPIVSALLERGSFNADSTSITANCLKFYAMGIPFYALREIFTSALTAGLYKKQILKNTVISVVVNIILNYFLINWFGYIGLPLATSISGIITCSFMHSDMKKKNLCIFVYNQIKDFIKIIVSTAGAILCCYIIQYILPVDFIILNLLIAVITYLIFGVIFDIDILKWMYQYLPRKLQIISKWNVCNI